MINPIANEAQYNAAQSHIRALDAFADTYREACIEAKGPCIDEQIAIVLPVIAQVVFLRVNCDFYKSGRCVEDMINDPVLLMLLMYFDHTLKLHRERIEKALAAYYESPGAVCLFK